MKTQCCRLPNYWSFAKLFSLLACVALGSLVAQPAFAQFEFGWEPFPPSSWDGGWDPILNCKAIEGTTTLNRNISTPGSDSVVQEGTVFCTFTDTANNFVGEHTCSLNVKINNLAESCDPNPDTPGTRLLTVTGTCPTATIKQGEGTIDCTGASFCSYAGSDPNGNTSTGCKWNLGWGAKQGQQVVSMTQDQCQAAFGSTKEVYSFSQVLEGTGTVCPLNAQIVKQGETFNDYCHSDTWDPAQKAFCDFKGPTVKNIAEATVVNFLTVDTEYSPNSINADCRPGKDQGPITLTVLGTNLEPHSTNNSIAVQAIDQASITVNFSETPLGFPVFKPTSCSFPNPDTLACKVPSCSNGFSVVENTINSAKKTATLTMEACLGTVVEGVCNGTRIVGDVETRKVAGL